jgi:uncharacterized membrane protein
MQSLYNRVAGQSVERLAALSYGIFAVAMPLLVLDLHVPAREAIHSERGLWHAIVMLSPRLAIFLMSVMTNGIFWVGQLRPNRLLAVPRDPVPRLLRYKTNRSRAGLAAVQR